MPSKKAPLIETIDLCKSYFNEELETPVLFDINLTIQEGEFLSIMGPSGSGKSTLMHILGFLDNPTSGKFLFRGDRTKSLNDDELARIRATRVSFVFQAFNLLPRTSVLDNVMLPLLYHPTIPASERVERAMHAIATVGLTERATYFTNQLSGGQQQRVAIARALVTEPDIIFADEPTGNLDSTSGIQVMDALQQLHDDMGRTIVLVTHEEATARHAERIIHLKDGRIASDSKKFKRVRSNGKGKLK
ncbi:macrolide ABC transporter ATP-binding protein [Candidatus Peregrinibacteria bacterium CG10_big_fil_rev_8_21_14_0_10_49_24]|nr:MAG: macrolide ABC transporter ATP-binding protein [Candidatus Peregrinibacteria bacterium CG11_big_fil_rev_8_21_14_0_20_49_14]PIR50691.1 MAG: macrolide ABC transporter ATP-binding protein [Candidatus Peregrinibacteria bacterium CG10_big_fil_rev_8_21_14_0_10_49_24]PJA67453.1 MAG: macrolide ABC transporter ATP-binding protein [Candidatus Peregrinibacteria bacterium CG_4_9_14_3_um_filter_49_12]